MAYATVQELREYLPQVEQGAEVDALLAKMLARATAIVSRALTFEFGDWPAPSARDVRAQGGRWLELPGYQPGSVATVLALWGRGTSHETTSAVTDYVAEDDGRLYRDGGWTAGAWYRVVAAWGYGPALTNQQRMVLDAVRMEYVGVVHA